MHRDTSYHLQQEVAHYALARVVAQAPKTERDQTGRAAVLLQLPNQLAPHVPLNQPVSCWRPCSNPGSSTQQLVNERTSCNPEI